MLFIRGLNVFSLDNEILVYENVVEKVATYNIITV